MAGNQAFGDLIRKRREEKKRGNPAFSLRQFAAAIDVSPTFLSRMETGEFDPPSAEKIVKMAELLELDRDDLLVMAQKADPAAEQFMRERPRAVAAFLRTARELNLTEDDLMTMTRELQKRKTDG